MILGSARGLLRGARALIARRGITLIGVSVSNLAWSAAGVQLALPLGDRARDALDRALDEVRDRFGTTAVTRAALVKRDARSTAYLMPGDDGTGSGA